MSSALPHTTLRRMIALAGRAPSNHNSQPWRWRRTPAGLELHEDRTRRLPSADPWGRSLVISCGAALHHLQVAAGALGWETTVDRVPGPPRSTLLARVELRRGAPSEHAETELRAIDDRCTDRRRFTSWPVPDDRLHHLAGVAAAHSTQAVPLLSVTERFRAELLVGRAGDRQSADPRIEREQRAWLDHSAVDGIPSAVLPRQTATMSDGGHHGFATGVVDDPERLIQGSDGLIVLCSTSDDVASWLSAGEALSALWLAATVQGLSVVPLSQVVEVAETREALQHDVLGGSTQPLLLVRIGWQEIGRSELPRTSRRPVPDVLDQR